MLRPYLGSMSSAHKQEQKKGQGDAEAIMAPFIRQPSFRFRIVHGDKSPISLSTPPPPPPGRRASPPPHAVLPIVPWARHRHRTTRHTSPHFFAYIYNYQSNFNFLIFYLKLILRFFIEIYFYICIYIYISFIHKLLFICKYDGSAPCRNTTTIEASLHLSLSEYRSEPSEHASSTLLSGHACRDNKKAPKHSLPS